jgi:hypothetical protein
MLMILLSTGEQMLFVRFGIPEHERMMFGHASNRAEPLGDHFAKYKPTIAMYISS